MARGKNIGCIDFENSQSRDSRICEEFRWIKTNERRVNILSTFIQPLTTTQIARRTSIARTACCSTLKNMVKHELVRCLNPRSPNWRLYWLSDLGKDCQARLFEEQGKRPIEHGFPKIHDWELYAWTCHAHRSAVIKALREPMQPSAIRRKAVSHNPRLRMSSNNCRDIVRLFRQKGIVRPVRIGKKHHLRYELTDVGKTFQQLLQRAEM